VRRSYDTNSLHLTDEVSGEERDFLSFNFQFLFLIETTLPLSHIVQPNLADGVMVITKRIVNQLQDKVRNEKCRGERTLVRGE
jgi:hypothetical protein